ncbi:Rab5-interacting protein-domain-containing protein [Lineolata rhizophorae]|uniref:ER membrane protein complex subunit 6 n=1 Tax=Lineolata rhizophorae TaxID=578093 RepID=A0A6A6NLZ7_9PEZI|nr:Rab5-interacting protein-domain-containing protein [Lineolata rhizophorae]
MLPEERELALNPIVQESVQHNKRTLLNTRNMTASLFGVAAGTLGLESYPGFLFYAVLSVLVSALVHFVAADGRPERYFYRPGRELWAGEVLGPLSSYVLTWTLFYGLVRA